MVEHGLHVLSIEPKAKCFRRLSYLCLWVAWKVLSWRFSHVFSFSVGEFQHFLSESTGFIFYGTERYLGCLPPNMLAPINVTGKLSFGAMILWILTLWSCFPSVYVCVFCFFFFLAFAHRRSFRGAPSPPVRLAHCVVFVLYLLGQRAFALYLKRSTCFFFISYKVNVRFPSMHLHYGILSSILLKLLFCYRLANLP